MAKGKLCGQYVGSVLAKREASRLGLDEAILLGPPGHVAEATGQNIFVVKRGVLVTPPLSTSVLAASPATPSSGSRATSHRDRPPLARDELCAPTSLLDAPRHSSPPSRRPASSACARPGHRRLQKPSSTPSAPKPSTG